MPLHVEDSRAWAEANFGGACLQDRRRTRRLVEAVAVLAMRPEGTLPQHFGWAPLRAVYRLCNRPEVTHRAVVAPHFAATRAAIAGADSTTLIIHDSTELNYTSHHALRGLGRTGNGLGRGLLQHNSLAVDAATGRVVGLTAQQILARPEAPEHEARAARQARDRQSQVWERGIRGAGPAPPGALWVDVADRDADNFEAMHAALALSHQFLFRGYHDRTIFTGDAPGEGPRKLPSWARSLPPRAARDVVIPAQGGRPERTAYVAMAAAPAWVPVPAAVRRRHPDWRPIRVWVERAWEPSPPADAAEPLEWILISSLPADDEAALAERCDWYARRPLIEVFHQVEKTGCREEALRFRTVEALAPMLGVLAVTAVRVMQLRWWGREGGAAGAEAASTADERRALRGLGERPRTARDFVRAVAKLGGFLGRAGDGEPGWRTLWRGYQRLQDVILGMRLTPARPSPRRDSG
jgi:hypothetical protein